MKALPTEAVISELRTAFNAQLVRLNALEKLPNDALQQKPDPKSWSVLETIEHMSLNSGHYLRGLSMIYSGDRTAVTRTTQVSSGRMGSFFTNGMKPKKNGDVNWKMKTTKPFDPAKSGKAGSHNALTEFRAVLNGFLAVLDNVEAQGFEGPKVISTLGPLVKFKIVDAFRFPVAHQARHFLQIDRTLQQVMK